MTFRQFHRWVGVIAIVFFLLVSITGVFLQFEQIFGEEEATKEAQAELVSPYQLNKPIAFNMQMLDTSRKAVLKKYGNQPVASIDWHLKDSTPSFVFHLEGATPTRVQVNATTGAIMQTSPDGEGWLIKLHTGEIIGDGGKFLGLLWGLALVAMSITGVMVYWQLLKSRKKNAALAGTGWRRYFWAVPFILVMSGGIPRAEAGSPFLTDDPGFMASGWEYKLAAVSDRNQSGTTVTAPIVDINYTVNEHFKWNLTIAGKQFDPISGSSVYGAADTDFKFKWRFQDEDPNGSRPAISIAPNITLPTASKNKGLGDEVWRLRIPVQFGKTWGKWYGFAETGYQFALGGNASDAVIYGAGAQYAVTPKWTIGGELNGSLLTEDSGNWGLLANVGTSYAINNTLQIQGSVGRTVRDTDRGGSELLLQGFLQWQFP